jgi:clavulanate-9-aldehyde reducatase
VPDLTGRRFLVTGGSSGIGAATARCLVDAGARAALLARRERELRAVADSIGAVPVIADVRDETQVAAAVDTAAARLDGLDGVVNVAGVAYHGSPTAGDPDEWEQMVRVNILGLLAVTRAAVPHLTRNDRGDLVVIGSMSGIRRASIRSTVYSGTKFAAHTIANGMREELAPQGIRVSVIAPSYVRTGIFDHLPDPAAREQMRARLQEHGMDPEVVAQQVLHVVGQPPEVCIELVTLSST